MIRRFAFEADIFPTLEFVPLAVRRKLDRAGVKLGLEQWQALGHGERLALCHLPANLPEEIEALRVFVREAAANRGAGELKLLDDTGEPAPESLEEPPASLVRNAQGAGFQLTREQWSRLDGDERYALVKLSGKTKPSHNFGNALAELIGQRP